MDRAGVVLGRGVGVSRPAIRLRVGAFIAGDSVRRVPLDEGLPTVEQHRNSPPLFQVLSLVDAGVGDVYVGDPALTDHSWSRLGSFIREDPVVLDGTAAPGVHTAVIEALAMLDGTGPMLPRP